MKRISWLSLLWLMSWLPCVAMAQEFEFRPPPTANDASAPAAMRDLATRILPVYEERDIDRYLTNLAALQLVAGDYTAAYDTRLSLQARQRPSNLPRPVDKAVLYDIYARARSIETTSGLPFANAFKQAFKEVVPRLNDRDAHAVTVWLETPRSVFEQALQKSFDQYRAKGSVDFTQAVDLIWTYLSFDAYRSFSPLIEALDSEDGGRRYIADEQVTIKTSGGRRIQAVVIRPKGASIPLPTLLEFSIHITQDSAREAAAHGYVGVVAYTRGKRSNNPNAVTPFTHDGEDARAVINWIAKQSWSDGRVGMVGGTDSGSAAWAVAKRPPKALKAIATSFASAPGIDFPMSGNIVRNSAYRWAQFNTLPPLKPGLAPPSTDDMVWRLLDQTWFTSGKRYRDLDRRYAPPNRAFDEWLDHPSYDRYWQKLIPFRKQFARVNIPVLTLAGYYGGDAGALYTFSEHVRYNAKANHTLLIGPYDDNVAQDAPAPDLKGYLLDAVAQTNLRELRYQWFDSIFKNAPKPALLKDRINYQVMGANQWRHAPSIAAMANAPQRYFLDAGAPNERRRLAERPASADSYAEQTVDFSDRKDLTIPPSEVMSKNLLAENAVVYSSEPLQQPLEISGQLSGKLDLKVNKQDVDLKITVYELLAGGTYLQLFDPYEFRASYAKDRTRRRLLVAGKRQQLPFTIERLTSRKLTAGSRIVLVLGVNKRPDQQLNLGSGKDVKEETARDARKPLTIRWYSGSSIDVPVRR
ncbi:MAG: CocE/NonD family hydrolase [Nevskia sp.]|nr:CocE/NonD family hydrolase [Nevskia sp.]